MIRKPRPAGPRRDVEQESWVLLVPEADAREAAEQLPVSAERPCEVAIPAEDLDQRGVWPIEVLADAFAPGAPSRDVLLPPGVWLRLDNVAVAVADLVNGVTVLRRPLRQARWTALLTDVEEAVTVAGLVLLPLRGMRGGAEPNLQALAMPETASAAFDLPGRAGFELRVRHLARAAALGHGGTTDPGLVLDLHGLRVLPEIRGRVARFALPGQAGLAVLRSRWAVPHRFLGHDDRRQLGLAVARIGFGARVMQLDHWSLRTGWYDAEPSWRWTSGEAELLVPQGARQMEIEVANTLRLYPLAHPTGTPFFSDVRPL